MRRLASYVLATAGFDVAMAGDGREALDQISKERPDIIVLDLNMPVMDGYAFVHEIEPRGRPQILILSADQAEQAQRELGVDASLQKPFRPDELISKVEALSARATQAN